MIVAMVGIIVAMAGIIVAMAGMIVAMVGMNIYCCYGWYDYSNNGHFL